MMSGLSIEGDVFFYENALEINVSNSLRNNATERKDRFPITLRKKVFDCSCCPPNLNRVLASLEQYLYHISGDTFFVDQYCESEYQNGAVQVRQETTYPLTGDITLHFDGVQKAALMLGPVVYCAEGIDHGVNLHRLYLSRDLKASVTYCDTCRLHSIEADGYVRKSSGALYEALSETFEPTRIRLIPYYAYANRGETDMLVWMNYR